MPRAGLSPRVVVDLALEVVDDGGPSGWADLGLSAVAHRAGVAVPSLYKHVDGLPARTHRSQGEQRSLALALRLAVHRHVEQVTGSTPVLLLDDVFSELDPDRSAALLGSLPAVQTLLTSAAGLPPGTHPEQIVDVRDGELVPRR